MTDDGCSVCVSVMLRSRIESSDLAPRSHGYQDYCGCATTIVTGREFPRLGRTPWSRLGATATVMRSNRRGAALPPGRG